MHFVGGINRLVAATDTNGQYSDPETARVIYLLSGCLVLMAVALAVATVWWWRSSKTEHPALGPLEEMGTRRFWRSDYSGRRRRLSEARPAGAAAAEASEDADPVDLGAQAAVEPSDYEDLLDEDVAAERAAARAALAAVQVVEPDEDDTDSHERDESDDLDPSDDHIDPLLRARAGE